MHKSVATINSPEFINLTPLDINPLMSACEIKVLYIGENRNRSFISKEVATEMAKTLRGAPIVGYYRDEQQDFRDHGKEVVIDNDGIKFNVKTIPYGFVAPNAEVWFKEFQDTNDFGETIVREYLMTTGYLWTGQFEECRLAVEGDGKPQSMELDENTVQGHWEQNTRGMDFFIINDAIFSKLCILGDDVEPCFEGASITAPNVSASFTKVDDNFRQTLFTMMQELRTALKGGQQMDNNVVENPVAIDEPVTEFIAESEVESITESTNDTDSSFVASQEPVIEEEVEPAIAAEPTIEEQFAALQAEHVELQTTYAALLSEHEALQTRFSALETAYAELVEFKRQSDDAKKDEMIGKFYMLSDDDKKDVIANKTNYSVEEIEEKLSVICFRKKIGFDLNEVKTEEQPAVTYNMSNLGASKPDWLIAVDNAKNQ